MIDGVRRGDVKRGEERIKGVRTIFTGDFLP